MAYQEKRKKTKLPSASFSSTELIKLVRLTENLHEECKLQFKTDITEGRWVVANLDRTDLVAVEKHLSDFGVVIGIYGANGESLHCDAGEVGQTHLFSQIKEITISNYQRYEYLHKTSPSAHFSLTIHFESWPILNFNSNPSNDSGLRSSISTFAINRLFCDGLESQILSFFETHKNLNSVVHNRNIYDFLLWLVFMPFLIAIAIKKNIEAPEAILKQPMILQNIIAIVTFIIGLSIFRLVFNIGRWLFPNQEITDEIRLSKKTIKFAYS